MEGISRGPIPLDKELQVTNDCSAMGIYVFPREEPQLVIQQ